MICGFGIDKITEPNKTTITTHEVISTWAWTWKLEILPEFRKMRLNWVPWVKSLVGLN